MSSERKQNRVPLARDEWRHAWRVVLSAHIGMATGAGLYYYVSSLFIVPMQEAFGWGRGDISAAAALGLLGSLSAPFIGRLADRYGARPIAIVSCTLLSLCFVGMSLMTGPFIQFVVLSAIFGIVAPGCTALTCSRAITGWFVAGRGQALGVMAAGVSIGALLFTPLISAMLDGYGLRAGYLCLSGLLMGVGLPAIAWGLKERSETSAEVTGPQMEITYGISSIAGKPSLLPAIKSRAFISLAVSVFCINAPGAGVLTQLDPLLLHNGVDSRAFLIAMFAATVLVGRVGIGWLFDRFDARMVAVFFTFTGAAGCLLFLSGLPVWPIFLAIVLVGLLQGMETDIIGYFVARLFDRALFGTIFGLLLTISLLGTAVGIVTFGSLYDAAQSYDLALWLAAGILLVAIAGYLCIPSASAAACQAAKSDH